MCLGMKASVRISSLTLGGSGPKTLASMESHGKRQDRTSQARRVRDRDPLVFGSLDLRDAFDGHVDGCRMNKGLKRPVMHALVQFPKQLQVNEASERMMLDAAIDFINSTHGGDAVFSARMDRDEEGQHSVDVFYSPKYEKRTKSRGAETWISTSKHGKELCHRHRAEIERRHGGRFLTGPRQVGIAMQSEFRAYLARHGIKLDAKVEKDHGRNDRVEPEIFKAKADVDRRGKLVLDAGRGLIERKKELDRREVELERERFGLQKMKRQLSELHRSLKKLLPLDSFRPRQRERVVAALDQFSTGLEKLDPENPKLWEPDPKPENEVSAPGPRM